jgi:hypothetical protein
MVRRLRSCSTRYSPSWVDDRALPGGSVRPRIVRLEPVHVDRRAALETPRKRKCVGIRPHKGLHCKAPPERAAPISAETSRPRRRPAIPWSEAALDRPPERLCPRDPCPAPPCGPVVPHEAVRAHLALRTSSEPRSRRAFHPRCAGRGARGACEHGNPGRWRKGSARHTALRPHC